MRSVGGFLGVESHGDFVVDTFHSQPALSTGRSCFYMILESIRPTLIYIPAYICDTILEPLKLLDIPYSKYTIDQNFEISDDLQLGPNDYLLYVNYFGLKSQYVLSLQSVFQTRLVVDNSQAFFQRGFEGCWSFNSVRKFFGVPDGAYLYGLSKLKEPSDLATYDTSYLFERAHGDQEFAFKKFKEHEDSLSVLPMQMSDFTKKVLSQLNYDLIAQTRRANYSYLDIRLKHINILNLTLQSGAVPLTYPLLLNRDLHQSLIRKKIFIPTYWPHLTLDPQLTREYKVAKNLHPLPIDQRYTVSDMEYLVEVLLGLI